MEKLTEILLKNLEGLVEPIMNGFSAFMGALALLLVGWMLAKLISGIVSRILKRIGSDKLSEKLNEISFLQKAEVEIKLDQVIKKFLYWIIMLVFLISAADVMGLTMVSEKLGELISYLPQVFIALLILAGGFYLAEGARSLTASTTKSLGVSSWKTISSLVFYVLTLFVVIAALERLEFFPIEIITENLSIILAGIMLAFAIAYGFAARPVVGSILASFYSRQDFEVGQKIQVGEHKGTIVKMTSVSLTLSDEGKLTVVPMKIILDQPVTLLSVVNESKDSSAGE